MSPSVLPKHDQPPAIGERALWIALAASLLARFFAALYPGAWFWGIDALRYLPSWAWLLWLLAAILLVPGISRVVAGACKAVGDALENPLPLLALAVTSALTVFLLPDRAQFVGDFLLRQGTSEESLTPASLFPQALPLDVALHLSLPTWVAASLGLSANFAARFLDALEAGALAWLAVSFARRIGLRGSGLVAGFAVLWCGGWLALFTGYSKAFTELSLLVLAAGVSGLDALRGRSGGFALLCATVAAGLVLHRLAVGFLPALAYVIWARASSSRLTPSKRPEKSKRGGTPTWLPLLLPATALLAALPMIVRSVGRLDAPHFAAQGEGAGSVLVHLVSPLRLLDLANLTLLLVPLALLAFLPVPRSVPPAGSGSRREGLFVLILGVPLWAVSLVLRPAHGMARGFDVFVAAGLTLAMVAAMRLAQLWRAAPRALRWAPAVGAGSIAPVLCYLLLQSDLDRSLVRVMALADGPPRRETTEQARLREYLGARLHRAQRYREATAQFARSAELAPTPNILASWSVAARRAGDSASEERALSLLLERSPEDRVTSRVAALTGLARIHYERGDSAKARELLTAALTLSSSYGPAQALAERMAAGKP